MLSVFTAAPETLKHQMYFNFIFLNSRSTQPLRNVCKTYTETQENMPRRKTSGTCTGRLGGVLMSGAEPIAEAAVRLRSLSS